SLASFLLVFLSGLDLLLLPSLPTRRSSDLVERALVFLKVSGRQTIPHYHVRLVLSHFLHQCSGGLSRIRIVAIHHDVTMGIYLRSEEHTSELQSRFDLVCRPLLAKNHYRAP